MIHTLEVRPEMTPQELAKRARKYAMTGGYELELASDLTANDLSKLIELYSPMVLADTVSGMSSRTTNAYRILKLTLEHPLANEAMREQIRSFLSNGVEFSSRS